MTTENTQRHDPSPVTGYSHGLIISPSSPVREVTKTADGRDNRNDWFYINDQRFNVHPFRSDLGGYPVRWIETLALT